MGLIIDRTDALIGIERTPSRLEIRTRMARLELHQEQSRVIIHAELPKVWINQYEAFASAGLKNCIDLAREAAQRGYQQAMEYIAKTAEDGDRLAAIEAGGSPIADIAERDAFPEHEFGIGFIPAAGPKFDVTGSLTITSEENKKGANNGVEGRYIPGEVSINYTPAKIRIYMKRYPDVRFRYEDSKLDMKV